MKTGQGLLTQFFTFDFAVNGAIGAYNLGIQIPNNAVFVFSGMTGVVGFVPVYFCTDQILGGPDLRVGTVNNVAMLWIVNGAATPPGNWEIAQGAGIQTNVVMDNSLNIVLSILNAPATAGKINGYFQYFLPA